MGAVLACILDIWEEHQEAVRMEFGAGLPGASLHLMAVQLGAYPLPLVVRLGCRW